MLKYLVTNQGWPNWLVQVPTWMAPFVYDDWMTGWVIPGGLVLGLAVLLCVIVKMRWKGGVEELMTALFTGFVFTWLFTTVIGALFRGPSQLLNWPWNHHDGYNPIDDLLRISETIRQLM